MFASNSSMITKYIGSAQCEYDLIINTFIELRKKNIIEVPLAYFIINLDISKDVIYDLFYYMLIENVIEKKVYYQCPECLHEQNGDINYNKCTRCGVIAVDYNIIEKFILKDNRHEK